MNLKEFVDFNWVEYEIYSSNIKDEDYSIYYRIHPENKYIQNIEYLLNLMRRKENVSTPTTEEFELLIKILHHTKNEKTATYISSILTRKKDIHYILDFEKRMIDLIPKYIKAFANVKNYAARNSILYFIDCYFSVNEKKKNKNLVCNIYDLLRIENPNKYVLSLCLDLSTRVKNFSLCSNAYLLDYILKILKDSYTKKYNDVQMVETIEYLLDKCISLASNDKKVYRKFLCDFLKNNFEFFSFTTRQYKLQKLIKIMESIDEPIAEINIYKNHLANANAEILKSLKSIQIPFDDRLNEAFKIYRNEMFDALEKMDNSERLLSTIFDLHLITRADIEKLINDQKVHSFTYELFPLQPLDRDGRIIINENVSPEEQKFLNAAFETFDHLMQFYVHTYIDAFTCHFKIDKGVEEFLEDIFTNNLICEPTRAEYLIKIFKSCLIGEYELATRNIVSEFEAGLRYFFQNNHVSTLEFAGNKAIHVDLNDMLKNNPDNPYRNKLSEFMTDELLFLLEYLLITNPGGNIRNDAMHGNMHPKEFRSYKVIYAMLKIFHVYVVFITIQKTIKRAC